jgi:pyridoxamine 5'-phosphate oxidase
MPLTPPDDLDAVLAYAWRLLREGAQERSAPLRTLQLATVAADGRPRVRTVILRQADAESARLRFFADARSAKVQDMLREPRVCLHGYAAERQIQLSLDGVATLHHGDDPVAAAAWSRLSAGGRRRYQQTAAPGTPAKDPAAAARQAANAGNESFVVVDVHVTQLEWLSLASSIHRRARFQRQDRDWQGVWVAP